MASSENRKPTNQRPKYVYEPLQSDQIRLLHVKSCSNLRAKCELKHVHLNTKNWYALSYVWGDAHPNREVVVNGGNVLLIRPNLLAALNAILNLQERDELEIWIWIDAICIDQENPCEKSYQVPLMDRIFSEAKMLLIWLGEARDNVQIAVEVLKWLQTRLLERFWEEHGKDRQISDRLRLVRSELQTRFQTLESKYSITQQHLVAFESLIGMLAKMEKTTRNNWLDWPRGMVLRLLEDLEIKQALPNPSHPVWAALLDFVANEWFRRLWTYQEILLARTAVVLLPNDTLMYETLRRCRDSIFHSTFHNVLWNEHVLVDLVARGHQLGLWWASLEHVRHPVQLHTVETLPGLLLQIGSRRATITKDFVYGLLGLVDKDTKSKLPVNYEAPDATVITEAVKLAIYSGKGTSFLSKLWRTHEKTEKLIDGLPSWCPDFSNAVNCTRVPDPYKPRHSIPLENCSKSAQVDYESGSNSIRLPAMYLDIVARCVDKAPQLNWQYVQQMLMGNAREHFGPDHILEFFSDETREWAEALQAPFPIDSQQTRDDIFARLNALLLPSPDMASGHYSLIVGTLIVFCSGIKLHGLRHIHEVEEKFGISRDAIMELGMQVATLLNHFCGKYIFETASGKIGFCYKPVSQGDKIVLVPGACVANIVSMDKTRYVGTAYTEDFDENAFKEPKEKWEILCLS